MAIKKITEAIHRGFKLANTLLKLYVLSAFFTFMSCSNPKKPGVFIKISNDYDNLVITNVHCTTSERLKTLSFDSIPVLTTKTGFLDMQQNKTDGHYILYYYFIDGHRIWKDSIIQGYYTNGKPLDSVIHFKIEPGDTGKEMRKIWKNFRRAVTSKDKKQFKSLTNEEIYCRAYLKGNEKAQEIFTKRGCMNSNWGVISGMPTEKFVDEKFDLVFTKDLTKKLNTQIPYYSANFKTDVFKEYVFTIDYTPLIDGKEGCEYSFYFTEKENCWVLHSILLSSKDDY